MVHSVLPLFGTCCSVRLAGLRCCMASVGGARELSQGPVCLRRRFWRFCSPWIVAGRNSAPPSRRQRWPATTANKCGPLLKKYCFECHSTAKHKGDLDLERFATADDARREVGSLAIGLEMLESGQMPPEDSRNRAPPSTTAGQLDRLAAGERNSGPSGRSGPRDRAAAEQPAIQLHDSRFDRARSAADARFSGRRCRRRRIYQQRRRAGDVAGAVGQILERRQRDRQPCGARARRVSFFARTDPRRSEPGADRQAANAVSPIQQSKRRHATTAAWTSRHIWPQRSPIATKCCRAR